MVIKMKELENKKALNEVEEEKVAGGDGLPTIFNPGPDVTAGQEKDIVTDPANNLYPPLGRPLPFPQDRRGNKAPVEAPHNSRIFV
jgi:hypothetical protein